jgi:hypothetical protein
MKWLSALALTAGISLVGCSSGSTGGVSTPQLVTPTISWPTPAAITAGTALSATQLDAMAVLPGTTTAVPGSYAYTPAAGTVENTGGTVTLSVAFTPYAAGSYNSASGSVQLTVVQPVKTTPTIAWAVPAAVTVGTALSSAQLDATASAQGSNGPLAGTFTYTPALGTVESAAGTQTLSATFTPTDTTDYNSATATVSLTVNAATPVIAWTAPTAVPVDTFLGATQLSAKATAPGATSALPGTYTYSPASGTEVTSAGNQTLSVTFTPADATDYTTATATVTLAVNAPSYTFAPVRVIAGGYVDRIVMHPGQQGLMYAGTDIGGAYRWDTVNKIWIPLTDFVTRANQFQIGIESIGIDPSDPQRLYLAAGDYTESFGTNCALYASDNQGGSFTTVNMPFKCGSNDNGRGAGERLAVDPNLGTTIFWGTRQNGLYQSADRGVTWTQNASFPVKGTTSGSGVVFETFIPSSSSTGSASKTIYVGVSATGTGTDPKPLYVTNDGGVTWSAVPGTPTGLYLSHSVLGPDGNLYFSSGDQIGPNNLSTGKILQYVLPTTTNPAGTWNDITPPRASGYQGGYGAVALDPGKPGTIMASTLDHYYPIGDDLWRSTNYGHTWVSMDTVGLKLDDSLSPYLLFGAASTQGFGTGNWVTGLAIDPFNSDHVLYGTGATLETTSNMTQLDSGNAVTFTVGALGIEETAVTGLISPPSGPANLLSVMGDLDGFQHTDITVSPAHGMFQNPAESTGTGIDFAQTAPLTVARVGNGNGNHQFGGYSLDGGATWTPFATNPAGVTTGSGTIAVSADGKTFVWSPGDGGSTSYSTNNGTTWTASTGAENNVTIFSDRVNAKKFYFYDSNNGVLYTSTDGGATFAATMNNVPKYGSLYVGYDAEGSVYLAEYGGLYHAALNATSFTPISGVQAAAIVTQGAAPAGSTLLTLYMLGTIGGNQGLYRSIDGGLNWIRFDGVNNQYGSIGQLTGDERVYGRVYIGTNGRGILHADSMY